MREDEGPEREALQEKSGFETGAGIDVDTGDKADPDLRETLDRLKGSDVVDVLVYPTGGTEDLFANLTTRQETGDLQFNVLELAGCIVVRAQRDMINELAVRNDVSRITINPTLTADSGS